MKTLTNSFFRTCKQLYEGIIKSDKIRHFISIYYLEPSQ